MYQKGEYVVYGAKVERNCKKINAALGTNRL